MVSDNRDLQKVTESLVGQSSPKQPSKASPADVSDWDNENL